MAVRNQSEDDEKLFLALRKIDNLSLPECFTSLHVLDADTLVLIISRLLECITRSEIEFPAVLPHNIAQRHRICTGIACKVKEIGFKGECGYNQLLYPVETQTRSLLTWLVLQLPRGNDVRTKEVLDSTALFNRKIAETLRESKERPWHHPNCFYGMPPRNSFAVNPHQTLDLNLHPNEYSIFDIYDDCARVGTSPASTIFKIHTLEIIQDLKSISQLESNFDVTDAIEDARNISKESKMICNNKKGEKSMSSMYFNQQIDKYKLPCTTEIEAPHSYVGNFEYFLSIESDSTVSTKTAETSTLDLEDQNARIVKEEMEERCRIEETKVLERKIQSHIVKLKLLEENHAESLLKISRLEGQLTEKSIESENLERDVVIKRKTLELIPFAAENILNLTNHCKEASAKLVEMNQKWDIYKTPYEEEIQMRKAAKEKRHIKCHNQLEEIKHLKDKMVTMVADMKEKEVRAQVLAKEVAGLPDNLTRASYTHRILDIVTSLDKQTKDIKKIISDIRSIQKLHTIAEGALNRADAVAEEMIFASASADPSDKEKVNTYKRLKKLRNSFTCSIETVRRVGQLDKLARELEAKNEEEQSRVSAINFHQINLDLIEIKQENCNLLLKINSANNS